MCSKNIEISSSAILVIIVKNVKDEKIKQFRDMVYIQ